MHIASDRSLILASGSAARRQMLVNAGLAFTVVTADVDEAEIRDRLAGQGERAPQRVAAALAAAKAEAVSVRHPGQIVIGADQVLALGSEIINKSPTFDEARATLVRLRARTHVLYSAVAMAEGGKTVWSGEEAAHMTMRAFADAFLERYLAAAGEDILKSVGCYHYEGLGVHLFERVDGDHFTILGMPLLPLLGELRRRGVLL